MISGPEIDKIERLLTVIDRMAKQPPDTSQADYELWEDLWEARQAIGCVRDAHSMPHKGCILR